MLPMRLTKEWRDLAAARATLLLALAAGPLVGHAFITAVESYAEASGAGGGPAALAQGLSPLDGIVVPTLGAYALLVTLLFPFVAMRAVTAEKESGALWLLLQGRASTASLVLTKFATLVVVWALLLLPGLLAMLLWSSYGGHLYAPELLTVLTGHMLRGALTAAVAMAAAAVTDGAATAAVLTLAVTLGTWALDFMAQLKGGLAERLAAFTPDAALRQFEHGEFSMAVSAVGVVMMATLLVLTGVWWHPGRSRRARWQWTVLTVGATVIATVGASRIRGGADWSEDRRNSFPRADEQALRALAQPLEITVHLAPEDPRLADLNRTLHKLRRTARDVRVTSVSRGQTGLFERSAAGAGGDYGEIVYQVGATRRMSRSTIEPVVLATIYDAAGIAPPAPLDEPAYRGWPLVTSPGLASALFYIAWPTLTALCWFGARRYMRSH